MPGEQRMPEGHTPDTSVLLDVLRQVRDHLDGVESWSDDKAALEWVEKRIGGWLQR